VAATAAVLILCCGLSGCAAQQAPPQPVPPDDDISGLWIGEIVVTPCSSMTNTDGGRCNAINEVTFLLFQRGSGLTGSYTCRTGSMICRNGGADDSGYLVAGRMAAHQRLSFTVMIPSDVTSCHFRGRLVASDRMVGLYECFAGGGIVDAGLWRARHGESSAGYANP
jgi:hypothetical protein